MAQETTAHAGGKTKDKDAMLNLFQTEVAEESTLGKFAAAMQDIEAADLLKTAVDVRNKLKGIRG